MSNRPARFTQADISRVLRAAIKTGERVVIAVEPTGQIKIIANDPAEQLEEDREIVL